MKSSRFILYILTTSLLFASNSCNREFEEIKETYSDGKPKVVLLYKDTQERHNIIKEIIYYPDGDKKCETHFRNGKENGRYICWDENGLLEEKGSYKDGLRDDSVYVYQDEKLVRIRIYEQGKVIKLVLFSPTGKKMESSFKNGVQYGKMYGWYETGELEFEVESWNGPCIEYHKNGKRKIVGQVKDGSDDGTWQYFNEQGTLLKELTYEKGMAVDSVLYEVGAPK
ncbi:MAG: hypothetical protein COA57_05185 [Flavobacteriales bacterium]|nr:hypothetical protein [Bacteroidales bacterium AH-315-I05]PCJ87073.1 MAG: hypothetical protein COA57_05185 [Flavobacteriales bacterium]